MKRLFLFTACILAASVMYSQSLEEIVKNYTVANKLDKVSQLQTIKISANVSAMGMDIPMDMWMKNPNKIKTVTNLNGQEMIQVYDGEKGYTINPMMGSSDPVEMTKEDLSSLLRNNMFENYMQKYLSEGKLTPDGEEVINGAQTFRVKAAVDEATVMTFFIDKSTYFIIKSSVSTTSQGMPVDVDIYPADYQEVNGLILPMKTTMSAQGMDFAITYSKVEVNVPMDDSLFKIK